MFLLSMSDKRLKQWYIEVDEADRTYAEELLNQAHLVTIDAAVAKDPLKEAKLVLNKFRL